MIVNLTRDTVIAQHVEVARNPWKRMKGLLGRKEFLEGHALVIQGCRSIHMFFMQFPIDVIFCDSRHTVVGLCAGIKPFAMSPYFFKASFAIEVPVGAISASGTGLGDHLQWE